MHDACVHIFRCIHVFIAKRFVDEQGIDIDEEIDKYEADCLHMVGYNSDNEPVYTARLLALTPNAAKLQRVAIAQKYRGQGLGRELMAVVEAKALEEHFSQIILGAQDHVTGFYEDFFSNF